MCSFCGTPRVTTYQRTSRFSDYLLVRMLDSGTWLEWVMWASSVNQSSSGAKFELYFSLLDSLYISPYLIPCLKHLATGTRPPGVQGTQNSYFLIGSPSWEVPTDKPSDSVLASRRCSPEFTSST